VKIISLKLTETEHEVLLGLVAKHDYSSISGVLRAGLGILMDRHEVSRAADKRIESERSKHKPRISGLKTRLTIRENHFKKAKRKKPNKPNGPTDPNLFPE